MSSRRKRVEPLVSNISTTEKGLSTDEKNATCCSTPSSQSRKSSLRRFGTYRPSRSITLTGSVTSVVFTLITSPASTSSGPSAVEVCADCCELLVRFAPPRTGGREVVEALLPVEVEVAPTRRARVCAVRLAAKTAKTETKSKDSEILFMLDS